MNVNTSLKPINLIVRILTIFIFFASSIQAQSDCDCKTGISLTYPDCIDSNESFELIYFLHDYNVGDNSLNKVELMDKNGQVLQSQEYALNALGGFANYFEIAPSASSTYSIKYYCKENSCFKTEKITIPTFSNYEIIKSNYSCDGEEKGKIEIINKGGDPISVLWEDGSQSSSKADLEEGTYTITLVSNSGCSKSESIEIIKPSALNVEIFSQTVDCNGNTDNVIKASVAGGQEPYSYDWSYDGNGDFDDDAVAHYMQSGNYAVVVRDANGCEASNEVKVMFQSGNSLSTNATTIYPIEIMESGMAKYDLMTALDPENGDIDNDGHTGSILNVHFYNTEDDAALETNQIGAEIIAHSSTQVFARVEADADCYEIASISLADLDYCLFASEACDNDPPVLLVPLECDGSGDMLPSGGVYEVFKKINGTIEPRPSALLDINGEWHFNPYERSGNFEIHYTYDDPVDGNITRIALFDVQALNPQVIITSDSICGNQPVLSVRANPVGGILTGPSITSELVVGSNKFYFVNPANLIEGETYYYEYFYEQTNGSGLICSKTATDSVKIILYPEVEITTMVDQYCLSQEVVLESVNVRNTTGLTYEWFDPNGDLLGSDPFADISNIQFNGKYTVRVTSPNGCAATDDIEIILNPLPILDCNIDGAVTCPNGDDGFITVDIIGATDLTNYSFNWDDGFEGNTRTGIKAGTYKVIVETEKGCIDSCEVVMTQPPLFAIDCNINLTQPVCFGTATGTNAIVIGQGGQPPYQYSNNGIDFQDNELVGGLTVGDQNIWIRDAIGCIDSCSFTLTEPSLVTCGAVQVAPNNCFGDSNGQAEATGSGGLPGYTYLWDNGETTKIAVMLDAGLHSVTVYDSNLCESYCDVMVSEPEELLCDATEVAAVVCNGEFSGQGRADVTGGNFPYTYLWDNGETTQTAIALNAGLHTVSITDAKGCFTTCQVLITQPPVLTATPEVVDVCEGQMVLMDCNADPLVVTHFWEFDPNNTTTAQGVILENTDQEDLKINCMNATAGIVYVRYLGSDVNGCEVEAFTTAEVIQPPSAGEDASITICNADETEFIQNIEALLTNNAEPGGTWSLTSGQTGLDISDITFVDFGCQPAGAYTFRYELTSPSNCEEIFANITVYVEDCFDVAIRKTVFSVPPFNLNDKIRFKIEVFNQGHIDAHEVTVTDYITPEFIFNLGDNTNAQTGNTNNWTSNGNNAELFIGRVNAHSSEVVYIDLIINPTFVGYELYNSAEITNYAIETFNGFKYLPPDEDDKVDNPVEKDDDVEDDDNNGFDNPNDDDQEDFAIITLCGGGAEEIACNDQVQISLDDDCSVMITPDMILEGTYYGFYDIIIKDENGIIIPNPVTGVNVGQTLNITIIDKCSQNSCWSTAVIEDKLPPKITCIDDYFTYCTVEDYQAVIPPAIDACEGNIPVTIKSDVTAQLPCTDEYQAVRTIVYYAKDSKGNKSKECTFHVYYRRVVFNDIVIPADMELDCSDASGGWDANNTYYPEPEESGIPSYLGIELAQHVSATDFSLISDNLCSVNVTYTDNVLPICGSTYKVLRTWSLLDWCSGSFYQDVQAIAVSDNSGPVITCVPDAPYSIVAEAHLCSSDWVVPAPIVIYDCDATQMVFTLMIM
jgi:uncharacterized repeat protein (TIGR01451 family)